MTQQDHPNTIMSIDADVREFAQRLQAAHPTANQIAESLRKAGDQIAPLLPSIASAEQGLKAWDEARKKLERLHRS